LWLHSLKVAQLLRSAACLHTNQSRSYLNHLVLRTTSINRLVFVLKKRSFYCDAENEFLNCQNPNSVCLKLNNNFVLASYFLMHKIHKLLGIRVLYFSFLTVLINVITSRLHFFCTISWLLFPVKSISFSMIFQHSVPVLLIVNDSFQKFPGSSFTSR